MAGTQCPACGQVVPTGTPVCDRCGAEIGAPHRPPLDDGAGGASQVILARYELRSQVGAGPLGAVHRAYDRMLCTDVAVKVLSPQVSGDTMAARGAFVERMQHARTVQHDNLVRILDAHDDGERCLYSMQFIQGLPLRQVIDDRRSRGQRFGLPELVSIVDGVCQALGTAHPTAFHGALKPADVLLLPDGLKVTGLAVLGALARDAVLAAYRKAPRAMAYLAPEIRARASLGARADVYSVGVLIYEMVVGEPPAESRRSLRSVDPDLPEALDEVVRRGVASDPTRRYRGLPEMLEDLHKAAGGGGLGPAPEARHRATLLQMPAFQIPGERTAETAAPTTEEAIEELDEGDLQEVEATQRTPPGAELADMIEEPAGRRHPAPAAESKHEAPTVAIEPAVNPAARLAASATPAPRPATAHEAPTVAVGPDLNPAALLAAAAPRETTEPSAPPAAGSMDPVKTRVASAGEQRAVLQADAASAGAAAAASPAVASPATAAAVGSWVPSPAARNTPPPREAAPARETPLPRVEAPVPAGVPRPATAPMRAAVTPVPGAARDGGVTPVPGALRSSGGLPAQNPGRRMTQPIAARPGAIGRPDPRAGGALGVPPAVAPPAVEPIPPLIKWGGATLMFANLFLVTFGGLYLYRSQQALRSQVGTLRDAIERLHLGEPTAAPAPQAAPLAAPAPAPEAAAPAAPPAQQDDGQPEAASAAAATPPKQAPAAAPGAAAAAAPAASAPAPPSRADGRSGAAAPAASAPQEQAEPPPERSLDRIRAADKSAAATPPSIAQSEKEEEPPASSAGKGSCPSGMRKLGSGSDAYCIDPYEYPGRGGKPEAGMTWTTARQKCAARGARLCTSREWQRGCYGRGGADYPYGKDWSGKKCNTQTDTGEERDIAATGSFRSCKSASGLYDMSGNVAEWVEDKKLMGGSADKPDYAVKCSSNSTSAGRFAGFRCCADPG